MDAKEWQWLMSTWQVLGWSLAACWSGLLLVALLEWLFDREDATEWQAAAIPSRAPSDGGSTPCGACGSMREFAASDALSLARSKKCNGPVGSGTPAGPHSKQKAQVQVMNMRRGVQPQENTIYDRMAELVWEYISEQPIVKLACEATVRADVATLLDQVDHISDAEDEGTEEVAPAELNRSTRKKRGLQTTGGVS